MKNKIKIYWIDLFCGAGGTSTGIHLADGNSKVIACVNHDEKAIESHKANHPDCLHLTEDIKDFKVVEHLKILVNNLRVENPDCIINIWASLECTNYSKAKGGLPRDADSRTLAEHLYMYLEHLNIDYLYIENVREFMAWGPLNEQGRPISRKNGYDYIKWVNKVRSFGYDFQYQILNAADYGAYTSRQRYFGIFAKNGLPIAWPEASHSKKPQEKSGMFATKKKKWKPVKDVLDLEDEGVSIFERKKPLSDNTLKRIYAGLIKFVANGQEEFIKRYNGGHPEEKVKSIDNPIGSISTNNRHAIVSTSFIQQRNSGDPKSKLVSVDGPARTITKTGGNQEIVKSVFLSTYYGKGGNHDVESPSPTITTKDRVSKIDANFLLDYQYKSNAHSLDKPCPTLVTKDKFAKIEPQFIVNNYSNGGQLTDLENPAPTVTNVPKSNLATCNFIDQQYGNSTPNGVHGPINTITANPKFNLVSTKPWIMDTNFNNIGASVDELSRTVVAARKHHYLMNPKWLMDHQFANKGRSIDETGPTIIARQDKKPLYLVNCNTSEEFGIVVFEGDSDDMIKIKEFMALYGIVDIKMRMLRVDELLQIQGFPKDYILKGTKTDQKRFIGNAVEVNQAKALIQANYNVINTHLKAVI